MSDLDKDKVFYTALCTICFILGAVLGNLVPLKQQKTQSVIVYQVDNAGGQLVGTITAKEVIDGHYTVTIGAYGKFLVTKEQFDSIKIGDDVPEYLKQRGIDSNKTPLELEGEKDAE